MPDRPDVPDAWVARVDDALAGCVGCAQDRPWTGHRWRVGGSTVAHLFGGEDQRFRITFRAPDDEVMAFEHMGAPYFRTEWGSNVVGMLLDDATDWAELAELLVESYRLQAPRRRPAEA